MTAALALAAAVLLAAAGADGAATPAGASDPAPPTGGEQTPASAQAAPAPPAPAPSGEGPHRNGNGGWRHAAAFGAHSTTFFSERGSQYTFHSASLGYLGSYGARGPFLHFMALMPLQARQDGNVYWTGDYYRTRAGADLLLGWHWRWSIRTDLEAEAGPGLHATLIYLPGRAGYRNFSAFPMGLGGALVLWWGTRAQRLSRTVTVGTYASAAYDFRDPAHAEDLDHGFALRVGVAIGLGNRR